MRCHQTNTLDFYGLPIDSREMFLDAHIQSHDRLKAAVRRTAGFSREAVLEHLFAWAFKGLVYPQIWEDPDIDMQALAISPDCHVVAIASGGCNILTYLTANPRRITAVDLNTAHVALNRLKLAAAEHLPSWNAFHQFFGEADEKTNVDAYWRFLAPNLDADTRSYWEKRRAGGLGRRRISLFSRNVYRHGLLGAFIGMGHLLARLYGVDPTKALDARTVGEQRKFFESDFAPLFDKRLIRWAVERPVALYGLGIPPAQFAALAGAGAGDGIAAVLRERLERLTCGFSFDDNYFAWQAFGRSYGTEQGGPLPAYLRRENFYAIRDRANRVEVLNRAMTEFLAASPDRSLDRFVLLDAQDWMTAGKMNALWREITRTARPGARVIFRTAAEGSPLPGNLDAGLLTRWTYEAAASRAWTLRDRSAIYGGFHLYVLK
jgi:S-adenosylmethionine-diacylglycerol 3-amino-3-carboxypropyl transferase